MALVRGARAVTVAALFGIGCPHTSSRQLEPKTPAAAAATPTPAAAPATAPAAATFAAMPAPTAAADFARDVRPILEQRCRPCHFEGGKMYERLPFDRPETIRTLGTKLFTRIKAEDEQAVVRRFLAGS
jgi:uncharacterized membrane protein